MTNFLKTLYAHCNEGQIEIQLFPSKKWQLFDLKDIADVEVFHRNNPDDVVCYSIPLIEWSVSKKKKKSITQIPCVWTILKSENYEKIEDFPYRPSIAVEYSVEEIKDKWCCYDKGIIIYFCLKEPANKFDLETIKNINEGIKRYFGESPIDFDDQNLRFPMLLIPQTNINKNLKSTCEIIEISNNYYELQDFKNLGPRGNKKMDKSVIKKSKLDTSQKICMENVYGPGRMLVEYKRYVQNLKENKFVTGITEIDRCIRGVSGGEVLTVIARAGSFKTAFLQNMLKNYINNSSRAAIFFSLEMPISSITERYHEMIGGLPGEAIEALYIEVKNIENTEKSFINSLKNLFVIPTKVSIPNILSYVALIEKENQIKIGVIGIDYLGLLDGSGFNEYEIISKLSRNIKNMAKMINLPVILLSQTSRKGGDGEIEISLDMGRGSGAIEEGADFVLGLWQEEQEESLHDAVLNVQPTYDLICRILKNRKGVKGSIWKLDIDPTILRIGNNAVIHKPKKKKKGLSY